MFRASDSGRARSIEDDLDFGDVLSSYFQSIQQGRSRDYRGSMLVVMHHGNGHCPSQGLFDMEALRRSDVFQIDPTYGRLEQLTKLNDILWIFRIHLEVEYIISAKRLNNTALPSITGFAASGPMFPRPNTAVPLETTATRFPRAV